MKMEKTETASDLLAEWKRKGSRSMLSEAEYIELGKEMDDISRRLDEMCEAAGISIQVGVEYTYGSFVYGMYFMAGQWI